MTRKELSSILTAENLGGDVRGKLVDLFEYLNSQKFQIESTVSVADVCNRLEGTVLAMGEVLAQLAECKNTARRNERARAYREAIRDVYESCGMRKVKGALGGTYYE